MQKYTETCKTCGKDDHITICDQCGEVMFVDCIIVEHSFGSPLDGERQDFCCLECASKFLSAEYYKEKKDEAE